MEKQRVALASGLLLKDEVFVIVGAAIDVHRVLGSGFLEAVYQETLEIALASRSIPFASQHPLNIAYKEHVFRTGMSSIWCATVRYSSN